MRSPWQLIKAFASRRKSDEAVPTSDQQVEVLEQQDAPKSDLEAQPDSDRHPASTGADAQLPIPGVQTDASHSQVIDNVALDLDEQHPPIVHEAEIIDAEASTSTATSGSTSRRAKAAQPRENRGKRSFVRSAVEKPVPTIKPAIDDGAELDLEIKSLRLQLSAKLREQNKQLRSMIERYGDE